MGFHLGSAPHIDEDLGKLQIPLVVGGAVQLDQSHDLRLIKSKTGQFCRARAKSFVQMVGMLDGNFPKIFIAGFLGCPKQQFQIHHIIDDDRKIPFIRIMIP